MAEELDYDDEDLEDDDDEEAFWEHQEQRRERAEQRSRPRVSLSSSAADGGICMMHIKLCSPQFELPDDCVMHVS